MYIWTLARNGGRAHTLSSATTLAREQDSRNSLLPLFTGQNPSVIATRPSGNLISISRVSSDGILLTTAASLTDFERCQSVS